MAPLIPAIVVVGLSLINTCTTQLVDDALVGTWSTKSNAVFTGPGFYNPVTDKLTEPTHPGISYSFSEGGHYEEAYYRALANRELRADLEAQQHTLTQTAQQPACPSAVLQWQHGTYTLEANGSLVLTPFTVDGRQVMSSPCSYGESVYTRYHEPELMKVYATISTI